MKPSSFHASFQESAGRRGALAFAARRYYDAEMNNRRLHLSCAAVAAAMLSAAVPALQAEERTSFGLPGVDGKAAEQPRIRPVEPIPETPEDGANGFVRIDDWDVNVSGSLTIDIGTFTPRTGR